MMSEMMSDGKLPPVSDMPPKISAQRPGSASRSDRRYPSLGSSEVDHSATSARSRSVTVIWPVAPSILTWPKNCMPADGGRFCSLRPAP